MAREKGRIVVLNITVGPGVASGITAYDAVSDEFEGTLAALKWLKANGKAGEEYQIAQLKGPRMRVAIEQVEKRSLGEAVDADDTE